MSATSVRTEAPGRPLVVGVLGGIGSGKSAVAGLLASRSGGRVVVADALGHEALRDPAIREAIVARFGGSVLDNGGAVDRRRLAGVVFRDRVALDDLEALTHPWIRRRVEDEIRRARDEGAPLVALDVALLLEARWDDACDVLVFVDAPDEVRLERVRAGRGWTEDDLRAREAAQLPLTRKHSRADHVVENSSTLESLGRQVDDLLSRWGLPRGPSARGPAVAPEAAPVPLSPPGARTEPV